MPGSGWSVGSACTPRYGRGNGCPGTVAPPVCAEDLGPVSHAPGPAVEELGEHWGGHRREQRVEGSDSCGTGDAAPVEPVGELFGLDGLSGTAAGEEPFIVRKTGAGQVVTLSDELLDEHAD